MADGGGWYLAQGSQSIGPMTLEELAARLRGPGALNAYVYGPGIAQWTEARHVGTVMAAVSGGAAPPPPPAGRRADEIDYEIFGSEMQYVEVTLDPNETVISEAGSMMYVTSGIKMETVFGDPSAPSTGFLGKVMAAGKRVLTGESLFMTTFTAASSQREKVAFAAPYPGKVAAMHLDQYGGELICQKDSLLCAAAGARKRVRSWAAWAICSMGIISSWEFGAGSRRKRTVGRSRVRVVALNPQNTPLQRSIDR